MKNKKSTSTIICALSVATIMLQGCAPMTIKQVSESARDTSGTYDGEWMVVVENTAGHQYGPGNWEFECADRSGEKLGPFIVSDGVASISSENQTYVNSKGKFRIVLPLSVKAAASGTSDSTLTNDQMTLFIHGSLEKQAGYMKVGIADLSNAGCTSTVSFHKQ